MRLTAWRRRRHTADLYDWTIDDSDNKVWSFAREVNIDVYPSRTTSMRVAILADEMFRKNMKLLNVKDAHGNLMFGGAQVIVTSLQPVVDPLGRVIEYSMFGGVTNFADISS